MLSTRIVKIEEQAVQLESVQLFIYLHLRML